MEMATYRWRVLGSVLLIIGAVLCLVAFLPFVMRNCEFMTVSPDSICFMQIWQGGVDRYNAEGGGTINAVKMILSSLQASCIYDFNRARIFQYLLYGIDGLTRWMLPSPLINLWIYLLLLVNSFLIVWVSFKTLRGSFDRTFCLCIGTLILLTHSIAIGPMIVVNLYAKYIWITFILLLFIAKRPFIQCIWAICAVLSDEIGLFAVMILVFMRMSRFMLGYYNLSPIKYNPWLTVTKVFFTSAMASFAVLFSFYGLIAIILNPKFNSFRSFVYSNSVEIFTLKKWLFNSVSGLFWRGEVLTLGFTSGSVVVSMLIGLFILGFIFYAIWLRAKCVLSSCVNPLTQIDAAMLNCLNDNKCVFYVFWGVLLLVVSFVVIPFGPNNYTHYGYPAIAILSVLLFAALMDALPTTILRCIFITLLFSHVIMLSRSTKEAQVSLHAYMFPDQTVSSNDLLAMNKCIVELQSKGKSELFSTINNRQELDFSGTWYYSRKTSYGDPLKSYFPVQGAVKVFIWPMKIPYTQASENK